jgi:tetratricopeptide (TPR) repeat protein
LALSLLGCIDADDGVRALGDALGVLPCGDEIAIARGLLNHPTTLLVVIDDANSEESCRAVETLLESRTGRFLLMIHDGIWETATVTLSPLSGGGYHDAVGNPTVARLEGALGVPLAESLASVGAELQLLAALEAGVPRHFVPNVPTALLRPEARDRAVLRPGAAALAVTTVPPESEVLQAVFAPLLELGRGGHLARQLDPRDILLLRQAEAHVSDPAIIAELRCARVRLLLAAGQPIPARRLLRITFGTSSRATGLLRWAEVDVALHLGEPNTAWNAADLAAEALGMAGEVSARACLWRRLAERLAERGDIARADEAWRRARQAARQAGDDAGIAAAMRGAAGLALSRGEWVGAGALHEEAAENLHSAPLESLNLQLGELALALVRGEAGRIRQALDRLEGAAGSDALVSANLWRRRADALLRQGDLDGAGVAADRAAGLYAALGEWVARGCALRLGADVASLAGQPHEAFRRYDAALHVQLDSRDWRGIIRTLDHLAVLADHLGDAVGARRYRENRSATIRAMGSA